MTTEKTTPVEQVVENMEPNWPAMFRYAVHIAEMNILYEASAADQKGAEIEGLKLEKARIKESLVAEASAADQRGAEIEGLKEEIERLKANLHTAQTISGERLRVAKMMKRHADHHYRSATKVNRKDK